MMLLHQQTAPRTPAKEAAVLAEVQRQHEAREVDGIGAKEVGSTEPVRQWAGGGREAAEERGGGGRHGGRHVEVEEHDGHVPRVLQQARQPLVQR